MVANPACGLRRRENECLQRPRSRPTSSFFPSPIRAWQFGLSRSRPIRTGKVEFSRPQLAPGNLVSRESFGRSVRRQPAPRRNEHRALDRGLLSFPAQPGQPPPVQSRVNRALGYRQRSPGVGKDCFMLKLPFKRERLSTLKKAPRRLHFTSWWGKVCKCVLLNIRSRSRQAARGGRWRIQSSAAGSPRLMEAFLRCCTRSPRVRSAFLMRRERGRDYRLESIANTSKFMFERQTVSS